MRRRRQPEIIAGQVSATGAVLAGDGFSVIKDPTAGRYTVTLTVPGFRLVSATANSQTSASSIVAVHSFTEKSFIVWCHNTSLTTVDTTFNFVAVGVQA